MPEADVARIRVKQPARVFVGALGRELTGSVYEIGVLADPLTRTYPVKITLDNADDVLKVGMVVDAFVPLPGGAQSLVVPREAVRIDERGAPCVFVLGPDQKVQRRKVVVVGFAGEKTALESGVTEGETGRRVRDADARGWRDRPGHSRPVHGEVAMKTQGGFIERAMNEWRIVVTLIIVLVAIGVRALLTMPRQEFPEFTIRQGLVIGVMPGASSAEVEERLAKPVEEYLFTYGEVNKAKTYSESTQGTLVVHVELREEIKGADAPAFWTKVRHGLNELKAQKLPPSVVSLIGMNDFGDTSALLLALTADGRSPRDLKAYLEVLEKHLRRLVSTSKLKRVGLQDEVIRVTVSHERLARYGIRAQTLWATLQGLDQVPASARLDTDALEMPVHVGNVLRSEEEVGDTIVLAQPGGANVRLKDVATITREYGHDDSLVLHDGQTAVVLSVEMRKLDDIVGYGKKVDAAIADAMRELPPDVKIWRVADQPVVVKHSVGHFLRDFGIAIISVILVTMLLLPLRVAGVAAVTIPICIFITLGILAGLGVELQTVSLAGLIIVLGMVVDNAIVIIDDHVEKLDHGIDVRTAAWKSARDLVVPVFTATIAIIMSYVPFTWFMTGMGGDFLASLPVTIAVALFTSMVVATLLVPILTSRFIRKGLHRAKSRQARQALDARSPPARLRRHDRPRLQPAGGDRRHRRRLDRDRALPRQGHAAAALPEGRPRPVRGRDHAAARPPAQGDRGGGAPRRRGAAQGPAHRRHHLVHRHELAALPHALRAPLPRPPTGPAHRQHDERRGDRRGDPRVRVEARDLVRRRLGAPQAARPPELARARRGPLLRRRPG